MNMKTKKANKGEKELFITGKSTTITGNTVLNLFFPLSMSISMAGVTRSEQPQSFRLTILCCLTRGNALARDIRSHWPQQRN